MKRPQLLDLFCGAGGAARGYHRAGFDILGIDHNPQPRYPFAFIQADALEFGALHARAFDVIHASPPCRFYSSGTQHRKNAGMVYPDLLPRTQELLRATQQLYVIENVPGARKALQHPFMLCGGMFDLGVSRHRYFETNRELKVPEHLCNKHRIDADAVSVTRHGPPARWYAKVPGRTFTVRIWHDAMGIDWMDRGALTQAIPPAYTEYIGRRLLQRL